MRENNELFRGYLVNQNVAPALTGLPNSAIYASLQALFSSHEDIKVITINLMRWRKYGWSCLLIAMLFGCDAEMPSIKNGDVAPAFALQRLDGSKVNFPEQYQNQVVLLRFWADWCPYCHDEMQALEPIYQQYREQGLAVLALNVMQAPAVAEKFVKNLGISYEILLDREGEVMRNYRVMGLPVTYIIDRKGLVRSRIIGESTPETLRQVISALL